MDVKKTIVVIGGGAAGFFGAIACAEENPQCRVILLEKNRQVLAKVRISGGGRCNVTHACFDPAELVKNYPRGGQELRGPFSKFQPEDTIKWFESRGVDLKIEEDGRVFPTSDSSESIIACLQQQAKNYGVEIWLERGVNGCEKTEKGFILELSNGQQLSCQGVLVASGSAVKVHHWLQDKIGHKIILPVPSLFTLNAPDSFLNALSGISLPDVKLSLEGFHLKQKGAILMTHWGFSGPAVLKLSAWGARFLYEKEYRASLHIDWLPDDKEEIIKQKLVDFRHKFSGRLVTNECPFNFPKNLWKAFLEFSLTKTDLRWSVLSNQQIEKVARTLHDSCFQINGKSTYKEEFVTCGGVDLKEVNFKTMESRLCPGLYFAGEVLDIDGVTGGFNFQNAWTTAWLAGKALAKAEG